MEEALIKLGLDVYKVGGIIGTLVFIVAILIFLLMTFYARRIKSQSKEILESRQEVDSMRQRMTKQLEDLLEECETKCGRKDGQLEEFRLIIDRQRNEIATYKSNENWFKNEIRNLEDRIQELNDAVPKTRRRPPRRRGPET